MTLSTDLNTPFMPVTHLFTCEHLCKPVFTGRIHDRTHRWTHRPCRGPPPCPEYLPYTLNSFSFQLSRTCSTLTSRFMVVT